MRREAGMDNFTVIYKILKILEKAMDLGELDPDAISADKFRISQPRWEKIMIMLAKSGYIEGIRYEQNFADYSPRICEPITPVITLRGLEYLSENTVMKRVANVLKGIKEATPGL